MEKEKRYSLEEFFRATLRRDVVAGAKIKAVSKSGNEYEGTLVRVTDDERQIILTDPRQKVSVLAVGRLAHIIVLS